MRKCIYFLLTFLSLNLISAQNSYELKKSESSVTVKGTSTLHSWQLIANQISADVVAVIKNNKIQSLDDLYLELPAKSLKSDKIGMNEDAHEALKVEQHPLIIFEMLSVTENQKNTDGQFFLITGNLSIAGVKRKIEVKVISEFTKNQLILRGSKPLKMTTFNIEPPKAFLGFLKADNEVEVLFNLVLIPNET